MNVVPNHIAKALRQTIRRVRMMTLWRGLGAVAVVALGSLLVIMAVDAGWVMLNPWPRYLLTILAYTATAIAAVRFLVRPLARSFSLSGMARIIDMHHPEMQERLSSAVELLTTLDMPRLRGSEALINALVLEAARDAQTIRPGEEVSLRIVAPFTLAAMAMIMILAILLAVMPRQTAFLMARAAVPFLNLPNVYATELAVTPGNAVIVAGAGVTIQARVKSSKINGARLRQLMADGTELRQDMNLASSPEGNDRLFTLSFTNLETGFRYQIQAGNALSRFYTVQVVHPPTVQQVDIRYDYPAYSRLEPLTEVACGGAIRALAGTRITVNARLSQPAPFARVQVNSPDTALTVTGLVAKAGTNGIRGIFTWTLPPGLSGTWAIRLLDKHGIENPKYERKIVAVPDRPPVAKILRLDRKELRLNATDQLPVDYAAEDDWGLQSAELLLETDGQKLPPRPLAIAGVANQTVKSAVGQTMLDMGDFTKVQRLRFQLRVTDTLPESFKGPQFGLSETYTIILDTGQISYERQALDNQEQQIRLALQSIQGELNTAKTKAQPLPEEVSKDKALAEATGKELDQMRQHLAAAEATARDMAERTKDGFYTTTANSLKLLADTSLSRAVSLTDQIKLVDVPAERSLLATNVLTEIDKALAAVAAMTNRVGLATAVLRDAVDLDQLAKTQRELARAKTALDRAAETPPGQPAGVPPPPMTKDQWQKAEDKIADQLAERVKKDPDLVQAVFAADQQQVSQSAAEAGQLAQTQTALSEEMKRATEAIQSQNQSIQDLATQQDKLAAEAKAENLTAIQAAPMQQAAQELKAGHVQDAIRDQNQIAATLSNLMTQIQSQAQDGGQTATPTPATAQQQADQSARQAEAAVQQAQQAVKEAQRAADQAQKKLEKVQNLAKIAKQMQYKALAQEMTNQTVQAQQASQEAKAFVQQAEEATRQAQQAAQQSRQASDQTQVPGALPQVVQQKATEAGQKSKEASHQALQARQAAQQAWQVVAEPAEPAARAEQAAQEAAQAARRALQSGWQAEQAEQQAKQKVEKNRQAEQAAKQAGNKDQARLLARQDERLAPILDQTSRAAQQAKQAAQLAEQTAQQAREAAQRSAATASPKEALAEAERAEQKSLETIRQELEAAAAAQQAQNVLAERSPQQLAQQAAQQAEQAAQRAQKDAWSAEQAALQAKHQSEQAKELAQVAQRNGQQELAEALAEQAKNAQSAADEAQRALKKTEEANQATKAATEKALQAAAKAAQATSDKQALDAARKTLQETAEAVDQARQAERTAQQARQASAGPLPPPQAIEKARLTAQQATQLAEQAQRVAQESSQQAQQMAQQSQQVVQQAKQQPGKEVLADVLAKKAETAKQASEDAQQAAQHATQAAQQAKQETDKAMQATAPRAAQLASTRAQAAAEEAQKNAKQAQDYLQTARQARESQQVSAIENLASRQEALRQKALELQTRTDNTQSRQRNAQTRKLQAEQTELAKTTAVLAEQASQAAPQIAKEASQALATSREADRSLQKGQLAEARKQAEQAAVEIKTMARKLEDAALAGLERKPTDEVKPPDSVPGEKTPAEPSLTDLAKKADQVAERQKQLGNELAALAHQGPLDFVAARQDILAQRVEELSTTAALLKDHAGDLGPQAQPQANQAAELLDRAEQQAEQAAKQIRPAASAYTNLPAQTASLAQAQPKIQQAQQASAQALQQASQTLDALGKTLAAATQAPATAEPNRPLLESYLQSVQAAESSDTADTIRATETLERAAQAASDRAREMGANPNPSGGNPDLADRKSGQADAPPEDASAWVTKFGSKLRDWLKLPGELQDEVLQTDMTEGPEEYRQMIQQYFHEVSKQKPEAE